MKRLTVCLLPALLLSACTADYATKDQSQVLVRITKITGESGGGDGQSGDVLLSDVLPVFNDNATLSVEVLPKNQNNPVVAAANDVFLERYEVHWIRSDGRNVEGVDVPYSFSGAMATAVAVGNEEDVSIILVRHQAKLEPPLLNLVHVPNHLGGGAIVVTCIARITIYGHTGNGNAVTASGDLTVSFADYGTDTQ
jgi:hypothetical protein